MNIITLTDIEKWEKFKEGDDRVLSVIYNDHAKSLYRYGLKFTANKTIIEDVIQDLFSKLITNRKTLGVTDNIKFYLFKSFKRILLKELKKELRYYDFMNEGNYNFNVRYSIEHDIILNEELRYKEARLVELLKGLSSHQKEAIYLKFTVGLSYNEIAEVMHMSVESSRNLIYRAIQSLRKTLKEKSDTGLDFRF